MEQILNSYYENNARKLHKVVDAILSKFGGITDKDYQDFYSLANEVFTDVLKKYDKSQSFDGFLYSCLSNKIKSEITARNRIKRRSDRKSVSIETPVGEDDSTIGDFLCSSSDVESELIDEQYILCDEKVEKYLDSLSSIQRQIIEMKMYGVPVNEIKKKLGLSDKEYNNYMNGAKMNENIALFTKRSNKCREEGNMCEVIPIDVTDNYRMDKFPLGSLLDDMRDGRINRKYVLQRKAYQWTERQKNKFLTRVLNNQPIPEIVICEQNVKGKKKSHLIDGLQRLSYSELFRADGIVIKIDGAEFYEIPYKEYQYDENGSVLLDEDGDAKFDVKTFNVIGKKFSELPIFLKDRFNKFNINVTTYFNCTDEQIAYHIRNYNNQEGMNKTQYEFTNVNIDTARKIKKISDNHPFFKDNYGMYTDKKKIKGDIDRVVVESIIAGNFLGEWKKEIKDSAEFVDKNATGNMFDSLEDTLNRLCNIVDKNIKDLFTTTNSPIWFTVFDRFKQLNLSDDRFKDFVIYFKESLDELKVDGKLFVDIYKDRHTKDKSVVTAKINGITCIMYDFLHINGEDLKDVSVLELIKENINQNVTQEDIDQYEEVLDDLTLNVDNTSKLLDEHNRPSLIAMVAYSFENDIDLDEWIVDYFKRNSTYIRNTKENFLHMKQDLDKYVLKGKVA